MNALMLALLAIRDLPPTQRAAWQAMFQHYVFEADDHTAAHIPETVRGVLGPLDQAQGVAVEVVANTEKLQAQQFQFHQHQDLIAAQDVE